jgi:RNA polymerase sigma-70 factor (ECF subfamily)
VISDLIRPLLQRHDNSREAFERLMADSYRGAYNLSMRLTGNQADAEDLLQESYVRAFRFFHRYDREMPFSGWLYRIITNVHIDTVRRKKRLPTVSLDAPVGEGERAWEFEANDPATDHTVMASTLEEPLQIALEEMNPSFRLAVVLADVEGLAYEEIAEIMKTSIGTVRSRVHRGRKQLRKNLERLGIKEGSAWLA